MARLTRPRRALAALVLFQGGFTFAEVAKLLQVKIGEAVTLVRDACRRSSL